MHSHRVINTRQIKQEWEGFIAVIYMKAICLLQKREHISLTQNLTIRSHEQGKKGHFCHCSDTNIHLPLARSAQPSGQLSLYLLNDLSGLWSEFTRGIIAPTFGHLQSMTNECLCHYNFRNDPLFDGCDFWCRVPGVTDRTGLDWTEIYWIRNGPDPDRTQALVQFWSGFWGDLILKSQTQDIQAEAFLKYLVKTLTQPFSFITFSRYFINLI